MRTLRLLLLLLLGLPLLVVALLLGLWGAAQTAPGLRLLERGIEAGLGAAGFEAKVEGLEGPLPQRIGLARLRLADTSGTFLEAEGLLLAWSPRALLDGSAQIRLLEASRIALTRLPASEHDADEPGPEPDARPEPIRLPVDLVLDRLAVDRLELGPGVPGGPASLRVALQARLGRDGLAFLGTPPGEDPGTHATGEARLAIERLDRQADRITASLTLDGAQVDLALDAAEAPGGIVATLAQLPGAPFTARLTLQGALHDASVTARVALGEAFALDASGGVDLRALRGTIGLEAQARAENLAPLLPAGLAWASATLQGSIEGDLIEPLVKATLRLDQPGLGGNGAEAVRLEAAFRPFDPGAFRIALQGEVAGLNVPSLPDPLAPTLRAAPLVFDGAARLRADGTLALQGLRVAHPLAAIVLSGEVAAESLELDLVLERLDLAPLGQGLEGEVGATLRIEGPPASPRITGLVGADRIERDGLVSGPVTLHLDASPLAPEARVWARLAGVLVGNPADLTFEAERQGEAFHLRIPEGRIAGASIEAEVQLGQGQPEGRLRLDAPDLRPFGRLLGQPLSGQARIEATLAPCDAAPRCATARVDASNLTGPGVSVASLRLSLDANDPLGELAGTARLVLGGLAAGPVRTDATLTAEGSLGEGIALALDATGPELAASLRGRALRPAPETFRFDLASLRLGWKGERVESTAPARLTYSPDGVALDRLRLRLRDGRLELAARAGENLSVELQARGLPLALAELAGVTGLSGRLDADARIAGSAADPRGEVRLALRQLASTSVDWLPPATIDARARLAGGPAALNATLQAGPGIRLGVQGTAVLQGDLPLDLGVDGSVEGRALDPLLLPAGRRLTGTLRMRGRVGGTATAPDPDLRLTLTDGGLRSAVAGLSLERIGLSIRLVGDRVVVERAQARLGTGTVTLTGEARPLATPLEADLRLVATDAALAFEPYVTARVSADLRLLGQGVSLGTSGRVDVLRADIRVPDRLPPTIVDLPVREIGGPGGRITPAAPAEVASALPPITLDVLVAAPRAVFLRGRGIDAEFGGEVRLGGTATSPSLQGGLDLRRGTVELISNRIDLVRGSARFRGGVTPDLDVLARAQAGDVTANLAVTGPADLLEFELSSEPSLPQDEVLARLLFRKSKAGLSPLELLELGRAVAQLSGAVGPGFDPLGRLREGLRLDRLSVTSGSGGADSGAEIEAGRYVADGVYVGAVQGAEAGSSRARVEIEVAPGLAVRGESGAGENAGTRVGVVYRFEY